MIENNLPNSLKNTLEIILSTIKLSFPKSIILIKIGNYAAMAKPAKNNFQLDSLFNSSNFESEQSHQNGVYRVNSCLTINNKNQPIVINTVKLQGVNEIMGYLGISKNDGDHFSDKENDLLRSFANLIVDAVEKYQDNKKLMDVFTDFIHKAIHDIKNPLTSISLTSELLRRKTDNPTIIAKFADRLDNASKRVFNNLDQLKLAFPMESSSFKLNINEIVINDLLADLAKHREHLVFTNPPEEIKIFADLNRLKYAIDCVATALQSEQQLSITLASKDDEVVIALHHNAPNDLQETKFLIAKSLIEMHKGKIAATEGCCYISLPLTTP